MIVIHSLIRCPNVSQFMSQGFTPTHVLLDLLLELLSWPCPTTSLYCNIVRIAVTTLSLFRFPFPFSVSSVYSCPGQAVAQGPETAYKNLKEMKAHPQELDSTSSSPARGVRNDPFSRTRFRNHQISNTDFPISATIYRFPDFS